QPVDRGDPCLKALPERKANAVRIRNRHAELGQPPLDASAVPALGGDHAPQYLGAALVVFALRDQLIDSTSLDLAAPGHEQPANRLLRYSFGFARALTRVVHRESQ